MSLACRVKQLTDGEWLWIGSQVPDGRSSSVETKGCQIGYIAHKHISRI